MKFKPIIFLLLLIPIVYSFNFGTVPKNDYKIIEQGESTQFTILLWNLGEISYPVSVRLLSNLPEWDIIVRPQEFVLNPTPVVKPPYGNGEYMEVSGRGIVKAETLRLFVKTPNDIEPGVYDLNVVAIAGGPKGQVAVFQERQFKLRVEIKRSPTVLERTYESLKLTGEKIGQEAKKVRNSMTGMLTITPFNSLVPFLIGLTLILISIGIVLIK
jgi:hypothetical protein